MFKKWPLYHLILGESIYVQRSRGMGMGAKKWKTLHLCVCPFQDSYLELETGGITFCLWCMLNTCTWFYLSVCLQQGSNRVITWQSMNLHRILERIYTYTTHYNWRVHTSINERTCIAICSIEPNTPNSITIRIYTNKNRVYSHNNVPSTTWYHTNAYKRKGGA